MSDLPISLGYVHIMVPDEATMHRLNDALAQTPWTTDPTGEGRWKKIEVAADFGTVWIFQLEPMNEKEKGH